MEEYEASGAGTLHKGNGYALTNPKSYLPVVKLLREYQIVHVHLFPALYLVRLAAFIANKGPKMIFTEHNTTNRRRGHWLLSRIDPWVYKGYERVVSISADVDKSLRLHLGKKLSKRIVRINNGVDLLKLNQAKPCDAKQFKDSADEALIMMVASFTPQKDQACLIKAMKHVERPAKLLLVGTGPQLEACKQLVMDLDLQGRVLFLGLRMDVPSLLKTVDIVVLSSHFEGLSLACIEGLASGKPFVASEAPGLADITRNAGLLFPIGEYRVLAGIVNGLLADPEEAQAVAARGMARAADYSMDKMVDGHKKLYLSCTSLS